METGNWMTMQVAKQVLTLAKCGKLAKVLLYLHCSGGSSEHPVREYEVIAEVVNECNGRVEDWS